MMGRIGALVLGTLVLLCALLLMILGSEFGSRKVLNLADDLLPQLTIELSSGNVVSELQLAQVSWVQPGVEVHVEDAALSIGWRCLPRFSACVDKLEASKVYVRVDTDGFESSDDEPAQETESSGWWTPAYALILKHLQVEDGRVDVNELTIHWRDLQTSASWYQQDLTVQRFSIDSWLVDLSNMAGDEQAEASSSKGLASFRYPQINLPDIALQYLITLEHLDAASGEVRLANDSLMFSQVRVDGASWFDTELSVASLSGITPWGSLLLSGEIDFADGWASTLKASGESGVLGEPLAFELSQSGPSRDSRIALHTRGLAELTMQGQLGWSAQDLPFDLTVDLQSPYAAVEEQLLARDFNVVAKGDLSRYQLQGEAAIEHLSVSELTFNALGNIGAIDSLELSINPLDKPEQEIQITSAVDWVGPFHAKARAQFSQLKLSEWLTLEGLPELPLFDGEISAAVNGDQWLIERAEINGEWLATPLRLTAAAQGQADQFETTSMIELGNNRLEFAANNHNGLAASLDAVLNDLSVLPDVGKGSVSVDAQLDSSLSGDPQIEWRVTGSELVHSALSLGTLGSSGAITLNDEYAGTLSLAVSDVQVAGLELNDSSIDYRSRDGMQQIDFQLNDEELNLKLGLQGAGSINEWRGKVQQLALDSDFGRWRIAQPAALKWLEGQFALSELCVTRSNDSVCAELSLSEQGDGRASLTGSGLNLSLLNRLLPENLRLEAAAEIAVNASLSGYQLEQADYQFSVNQAVLSTNDVTLGEQQFTVERFNATGNYLDGQLFSDITLDSEQMGVLRSELTLPGSPREEMAGSLSWSGLELASLSGLFPDLTSLQGAVEAQLTLAGTRQQPLVYGELALDKGEVSSHLLPFEIAQLQTALRFNGNRATVAGQFISSGQPAKWSGQFDWRDALQGRVQFDANRLPVVVEPYARAVISPDLELSLDKDLISLSGDLVVNEGSIEVKQLPETAVQLSPDVIVIEEQKEPFVSRALAVSIRLIVSENLSLKALGLDTQLSGQLQIDQRPGESMLTNGRIELIDGSFRAYGQNLVLTKGWLLFSGSMEQPYLDIEAIRNPDNIADGVTVGVRVVGLADAPQVTLFSEPTMSQNEQLSYLLRGRGLEDSEQDQNALTSMLISLGVARASGTVGNLGSSLGLNDLSVSANSTGSDTQVEVSAYILPGVQVRYGMGVFNPVNELTVRYEVLPKLFLEAFSGLNSAIDLYYEFSVRERDN